MIKERKASFSFAITGSNVIVYHTKISPSDSNEDLKKDLVDVRDYISVKLNDWYRGCGEYVVDESGIITINILKKSKVGKKFINDITSLNELIDYINKDVVLKPEGDEYTRLKKVVKNVIVGDIDDIIFDQPSEDKTRCPLSFRFSRTTTTLNSLRHFANIKRSCMSIDLISGVNNKSVNGDKVFIVDNVEGMCEIACIEYYINTREVSEDNLINIARDCSSMKDLVDKKYPIIGEVDVILRVDNDGLSSIISKDTSIKKVKGLTYDPSKI